MTPWGPHGDVTYPYESAQAINGLGDSHYQSHHDSLPMATKSTKHTKILSLANLLGTYTKKIEKERERKRKEKKEEKKEEKEKKKERT